MPVRSLLAMAAIIFAGLLPRCSGDDVGRCCTIFEGSGAEIPVAEPGQTTIRRDPGFDCDGLACVAYQGSAAYCTKDCIDDRDCPDGFVCQSVLQSSTPTTSQICPNDKFCVRDAHQCTD